MMLSIVLIATTAAQAPPLSSCDVTTAALPCPDRALPIASVEGDAGVDLFMMQVAVSSRHVRRFGKEIDGDDAVGGSPKRFPMPVRTPAISSTTILHTVPEEHDIAEDTLDVVGGSPKMVPMPGRMPDVSSTAVLHTVPEEHDIAEDTLDAVGGSPKKVPMPVRTPAISSTAVLHTVPEEGDIAEDTLDAVGGSPKRVSMPVRTPAISSTAVLHTVPEEHDITDDTLFAAKHKSMECVCPWKSFAALSWMILASLGLQALRLRYNPSVDPGQKAPLPHDSGFKRQAQEDRNPAKNTHAEQEQASDTDNMLLDSKRQAQEDSNFAKNTLAEQEQNLQQTWDTDKMYLLQLPDPEPRPRQFGASFVIPLDFINKCPHNMLSFDIPTVPAVWPLRVVMSRPEGKTCWTKIELTVDIIAAIDLPPLLSCCLVEEDCEPCYLAEEDCGHEAGTGGTVLPQAPTLDSTGEAPALAHCGGAADEDGEESICDSVGGSTYVASEASGCTSAPPWLVIRNGGGALVACIMPPKDNRCVVQRQDQPPLDIHLDLSSALKWISVSKRNQEIGQARTLAHPTQEHMQVDTLPDMQSPESALLLMSALAMLSLKAD